LAILAIYKHKHPILISYTTSSIVTEDALTTKSNKNLWLYFWKEDQQIHHK